MNHLFNGTWKIDLENSVVWDDDTNSYAKDEVEEEIIVIKQNDDAQDYEVRYGKDPEIRMGYQATFDSSEWTPYLVREVVGEKTDITGKINAFKQRIRASEGDRERHFVVGRPYGLIRLIYVDELTHFRVSRNPQNGRAQVMMQRRMEEDGNSYLATVLDTNGVVFRKRRFVRTSF